MSQMDDIIRLCIKYVLLLINNLRVVVTSDER